MKRLALSLLVLIASCQLAPAQTAVTTAAPTAGAFSDVLTRSDTRRGCTITNIGTTQGYCQVHNAGFTPTTANSVPVAANGGQFYCAPSPGSHIVMQDPVACTCASGTCAFVIDVMGQ